MQLNTSQKLFFFLSQLPLIGLWTPLSQFILTLENNNSNSILFKKIIISIGWEIGVFFLTFLSDAWKEIRKWVLEIFIIWIKGELTDISSGFLRRYKKQIKIEYNTFDVGGIGVVDAAGLNLEQIFVDIQILRTANINQAFIDALDMIAKKEVQDSRSIWTFIKVLKPNFDTPNALTIIGAPGSGKTTLLKHIAITLASNKSYLYSKQSYIPIILFLRDHVSNITQEQPLSLAQLALDDFKRKHTGKLMPPDKWFENRLEEGKCLVLLDGLDEVADLEKRKLVSHWVDQQTKNYSDNLFIITSRPQGYREAPLKKAFILQVLPFNARQVETFITNWYLAHELDPLEKKDNRLTQQNARTQAQDLINRLRANEALSALAVNPLLLTMISIVHRNHKALPGNRVQLYKQICEDMLGGWRESRGIKQSISVKQKLKVLCPLAAHMMKVEKKREMSKQKIIEFISPLLKEAKITNSEEDEALAAEKFLSDIQANCGFLLEREAGKWGFAHFTFQEYLTSIHWIESKNTSHMWLKMVDEGWWQETLRLYGAQENSTKIAQACLKSGTVTALTLTAELLEWEHDKSEELKITNEICKQIEFRLIEGLESNDEKLRRFAAELLLSRRLRRLKHIDGYRAIDPGFLSCAEYQLFLDEMYQKGKYHQPDHWISYTFPKGDALKPIAGIRGEDAEAFCIWLTHQQGDSTVYRLPNKIEAQQILPTHKGEDDFLTWYKNEGNNWGILEAPPSLVNRVQSLFTNSNNIESYFDSSFSKEDIHLKNAFILAFSGIVAMIYDLCIACFDVLFNDLSKAFNTIVDRSYLVSIIRSGIRKFYNRLVDTMDIYKVKDGLFFSIFILFCFFSALFAMMSISNLIKFLLIFIMCLIGLRIFALKSGSDFPNKTRYIKRSLKKNLPTPFGFALTQNVNLVSFIKKARNSLDRMQKDLDKEIQNEIDKKISKMFTKPPIQRSKPLEQTRLLAKFLMKGLNDMLELTRYIGLNSSVTDYQGQTQSLAKDILMRGKSSDLSIEQFYSHTLFVTLCRLGALHLAFDRSLQNYENCKNIIEYQNIDNIKTLLDKSKDSKQAITTLESLAIGYSTDIRKFDNAPYETSNYELRHSQRILAVKILEYSLSLRDEVSIVEKPTWWRKLFSKKFGEEDISNKLKTGELICKWLKIVIAREDEKLPAWESVRIVRDRGNYDVH